MTTKVEIFHNVARDEKGRNLGFFGYEDGQPVVKVYEYEILEAPSRLTAHQYAEAAYAICNGQVPGISGFYFARALRSLSVGDVVKVGDHILAVGSVAWRRITEPLNDVTDTFKAEAGIRPWTD